MAKLVLKALRNNPENIRELLNSSLDLLIVTRLNILYQVTKVNISREVAKWYGASFNKVVNWIHSFEENGIEVVEKRPGRGRKPYLTN
ncbi:hypothetical protein K8352_18980 [Flavobacteriaceae bacterium F89]|uniref:Uncharacterized protein n=1 Tax=Cerina litoralis TaxID=2874477 RepID=A0AAE3JQ73_9FLAO|nr:hypothetical protein [Cerina litoralis]MCG2462855.1 hypothetical protein [Cerina litoralis]